MERDIESMLKEDRVFPPADDFCKRARCSSNEQYEELYLKSISEPEKFWAEQAEENLSWFKKWDQVMRYDFETIGEKQAPYVSFFSGGKLNASVNCLDRHVDAGRGEKIALYWQGEDENEKQQISYEQLLKDVCQFANGLRRLGIKKGDTVTIYMPMIPQLPVAVLACARIGAIHSVVFSAFSPDSLKNRINDCNSKLVITSDIGVHAGKTSELKQKVDQAIADCPSVEHVVVFQRGSGQAQMTPGRDSWWHEVIDGISKDEPCAPEEMDAEDPLFILYTSGSTGKPKGVMHTTGGYLLYTTMTFKWIFDIKDEDIFWCTADVGWITGHSYLIYGPLSNGATNVMFEGVPTYPQPDRFWKIVEDYKVSIFYTAPTAIRALERLGDEWPNKHDLSSLRLLGTVGEPINPEAWMWYRDTIGKGNCPVVDTWWQTETGGIMITTLPGAHPTKPGSAGKPFFGIAPSILRDDGSHTETNEGGSLYLVRPWPGMLRGVYGEPSNETIKRVYFSNFNGRYFTGDGCRRDEDGYYWLLGRIDDVINISGHRLATAEVESALVAHDTVAESAVVGFPHEIKGQGIYCFVTLKQGIETTDELRQALVQHVREEIGPIATPEKIHFTPALPKTRSGKIMRRILRKVAAGEIEQIGDTSTLADPSVVDDLVANRV